MGLGYKNHKSPSPVLPPEKLHFLKVPQTSQIAPPAGPGIQTQEPMECISHSIHSRGFVPRTTTASYGNSLSFTFLKKWHGGFWSSSTILHSDQQFTRIPIFPHSHQHLLLSIFFSMSILVCMKWYLFMVLICIFLIILILDLFSYTYWPLVYLLWGPIQILCLFLMKPFVFPLLSYNIFSQYMTCIYIRAF